MLKVIKWERNFHRNQNSLSIGTPSRISLKSSTSLNPMSEVPPLRSIEIEIRMSCRRINIKKFVFDRDHNFSFKGPSLKSGLELSISKHQWSFMLKNPVLKLNSKFHLKNYSFEVEIKITSSQVDTQFFW